MIKPALKEPLSHTTHRANKDNRLTKNAPHLDEELAFSGTKTNLLCIIHLIRPLEFSFRVIRLCVINTPLQKSAMMVQILLDAMVHIHFFF